MTATVIGFVVTGPDNDRYMFGGDAQPARCPECGFAVERDWVDPSFRLRAGRTDDVSYTYDGRLIVSDSFRAAIKDFPGAIYHPLPSQPGWSMLTASRTVAFDTVAYGTTFEEFCDGCGTYTEVAGATPAILVDPPIPLPDAVLRTDVEFGSGDERSPLILVGPGVADALRLHRLRGLHLEPVEHGDSDRP